ncbi:hypothetical protein ACE22S_000401 [Campylobacter upsaliensis]
MAFSFIKYYYYEIYKSKIDLFIFSVLNENLGTIFSIIYKDYPLFSGIFALILISIFCFLLNNRILKSPFKPLKLKPISFIFVNLLLIGIYIIALRGVNHHVFMNERNYRFANLEVINDTALNPLITFVWAKKAKDSLLNFLILARRRVWLYKKSFFHFQL